MEKSDIARELFLSGANCCQAVAGAFAEECGMDQSTMLRLASGFGAGVARLREVCGAASGIVIVVGLLDGNDKVSDKAAKDAHYDLVQKLLGTFKAEAGSLICRDLLELEPQQSDGPVSEARTEAYYKERPCTRIVVLAAKILEKYIEGRSKA